MERWDGKTEEEIEQEVNAFAEEYKKSQQNQDSTISTAATDPQVQCMANQIASSYADTFSTALIVSLFDNPSWANFKKAAKQMIKAGAKANIIGLSYELFKALKACQGAGGIV